MNNTSIILTLILAGASLLCAVYLIVVAFLKAKSTTLSVSRPEIGLHNKCEQNGKSTKTITHKGL